MKKNYLINEMDSNVSFAVIKDAKIDVDMVNRVAVSVCEEFGYESAKLIGGVRKPKEYDETTLTLKFDCITEDGDEEIREIELNQVAIY